MHGHSNREMLPALHPVVEQFQRVSRAGSNPRRARSLWLSRWLALVCVGALLVASRAADAFEIFPSETERTILAEALGTKDLLFSIENNGNGEAGLLPFDTVVMASAPLGDVSADASADQQSRIDLTELSGDGLVDANVSIAPTSSGASTSGKGESIYRVVFSVDVPTTFALSGHVEASALPAVGDTFAIVELIDFDTLDILFSFSQSDGGMTDFSEVIALVPGVNYELYASALATAEARDPDTNEIVFASYSVLLPEPGTLAGMTASCGALGLLARRRRARPS
jgi:hypothetical protein